MVIPRSDPLQPDAPRPDRLFLNTHLHVSRCAPAGDHRSVPARPRLQAIWISVGIAAVAGMSVAEVREAVRRAAGRFLSPLPPGGTQTLDERDGTLLAHAAVRGSAARMAAAQSRSWRSNCRPSRAASRACCWSTASCSPRGPAPPSRDRDDAAWSCRGCSASRWSAAIRSTRPVRASHSSRRRRGRRRADGAGWPDRPRAGACARCPGGVLASWTPTGPGSICCSASAIGRDVHRRAAAGRPLGDHFRRGRSAVRHRGRPWRVRLEQQDDTSSRCGRVGPVRSGAHDRPPDAARRTTGAARRATGMATCTGSAIAPTRSASFPQATATATHFWSARRRAGLPRRAAVRRLPCARTRRGRPRGTSVERPGGHRRPLPDRRRRRSARRARVRSARRRFAAAILLARTGRASCAVRHRVAGTEAASGFWTAMNRRYWALDRHLAAIAASRCPQRHAPRTFQPVTARRFQPVDRHQYAGPQRAYGPQAAAALAGGRSDRDRGDARRLRV